MDSPWFARVASLALVWMMGVPVQGAESTDWIPVGVARTDITPAGPVRLCGYASRETESDGVAMPLRACALALGSDAEGPRVLITAELIGVPESVLVGPLAERLERAGIERANLAVCATHTHTGPCLAGFLNETHFSAFLPEDQMARLRRYTEFLLDRLEAVALEALKKREPGRLAWSQGTVDFAINRRVVREGKWVGFGRNQQGPVDHALPVMRVTDRDGKVKAVWVNYACHCTTYAPKFNRIHGDWAGMAAREIEARHAGSVALVSIGCGADANPEPRGATEGEEMVTRHGRAVAVEVDRLMKEGMQPLAGPPLSRFRVIPLPLDHVPDRKELEARLKGPKRPAFYARLLLDRMERGETLPASFPYPIQTWTFGQDLAVVFLAGEVVVDYATRLKRELGAEKLWVTAYANDAPCYVASRRVIQEGGYEVDDSMNNYDKPTRLALEAEDRIIVTVKDLLPAGFPRSKPGR